jgi:drug/metabolite transporter (DMT)-like permease
MNYFLLALVPPALWAVSNHFDKYIVGKYFKSTGVGAMLIFSALVGILVLPIAFLFQTTAFSINPGIAALIALNGCLYLVAVLPYLKALSVSDASAAVPIFQVIPIISFVLAWLVLGETLTVNQMVGGLFIVLGAIIISFEMQGEGHKFKLRGDTLSLMLLSSFIFALNFLMFKVFAIDTDFWTTVFWESAGFIGFGLALLAFVRPYRRDFLHVFNQNGKMVISLNVVNEVFNITAKLVFNYVSLLMAITLAWIAVGFQPLFVLLYSVVLTAFFPHINNEKVTGKHLVQKVVSILIMLFGAFILNS